MLRPILLSLFLVAPALPLSAQDQGYKITRPDGTVEFTDKPAPGAKPMPLPKAQGYEAPTVTPPPPATTTSSPSAPTRSRAEEPGYRRLAISTPAQDETLRDTQGVVSVTVQLEPALQSGHTIVILLDGKEVARGRGSQFTVTEVERGTHVLGAEVQDAQGKRLQSASGVTIHVFQFSSLHKRQP